MNSTPIGYNCELPNPDQFDSDGDGIGDACSQCEAPIGRDFDGDGYDDGCDRCIGAGALDTDEDDDGIPDGCDPCKGGQVAGNGEIYGGVGVLGRDINGDGIDDGCMAFICESPLGNDFDGDLVDDGCDDCPLGPPHDEDGDFVDDACDSCPGDANTDDQTSPIGFACDPDITFPNRRVVFDPFLVPSPQWAFDAGWEVAADVAHASGTNLSAKHSATLLEQLLWRVQMRLEVEAMSRGGIRLTGPAGVLECEVTSAGEIRVTFKSVVDPVLTDTAELAVDASAPVTLRMTTSRPTDFLPSFFCQAIDPATGTVLTSASVQRTEGSLDVGMFADGDVRVHWIDAISGEE